MEKKRSIATRLLLYIQRKPRTRKEMLAYIWKLAGREGNPPRGHWSTNFTNLIRKKKVMKKDGRSGKYRITEIGKRNIKNPFKLDIHLELAEQKSLRQHYHDYFQETLKDLNDYKDNFHRLMEIKEKVIRDLKFQLVEAGVKITLLEDDNRRYKRAVDSYQRLVEERTALKKSIFRIMINRIKQWWIK